MVKRRARRVAAVLAVATARSAASGTPGVETLENGTVTVTVGTRGGPRILGYAFHDGVNRLGTAADAVVTSPLGEFRPLGGHRLWAAPERWPETYAPDDGPVDVQRAPGRLVLRTGPDRAGFERELTVALDRTGTGVSVGHRIVNRGPATVEVASWAVTIMAPGGTAILPQEPRQEGVREAVRALTLWGYTDMSDPRYTFGKELVLVRAAPRFAAWQKIGAGNAQGWLGYLRGRDLFLKTFPYDPAVRYPDRGSNCQIYTQGGYCELESLGPLVRLAPNESTGHTERWTLHRLKAPPGGGEAAMVKALAPYVPPPSTRVASRSGN